MRTSFPLQTCGVVGCLLLAQLLLWLPEHGDAFLCPTAATGSGSSSTARVAAAGRMHSRPQQRLVALTRAIGRENIAGQDEGDGGDGTDLSIPAEKNACRSPPRNGPLRRLRSLFSRKTATAVAFSAMLGVSAPGRAEALFGRGKAVEAPPAAAAVLEQRLEEVAEGLVAEGEELLTEADEGAAEGLQESGFEESFEESFGDEDGDEYDDDYDGDGGGGDGGGGGMLSSSVPATRGGVGARVGALQDNAKDAVVALREKVLQNKEASAAVAIVGVAGASYLVVSRSGRGRGRRRKWVSKVFPKSALAGRGQPRISPEVTAADAKRKADKIKETNFDVDLELFGDAVSDLPSRPPPPTPPVSESSPSPSEAIQAAKPAQDVTSNDTDAVEPLPVQSTTTIDTTIDTTSSTTTTTSTAPAPAPAPAPSPPFVVAKRKPEKKRGSMMNLFKRDNGPQRSTSLEDALSGETPDVANFRQGAAAVLSESAPQGLFLVEEPALLRQAAVSVSVSKDEAGKKAAAASRVGALTQLMQAAGLSRTEGAEAVADVVNSMVVRLVDTAVSSDDADQTALAANALLSYMDGAGALFEAVCPGVALDPPIKYNGSFKRGKLEKVFEAAARVSLKKGDDSQMTKLDRLQDLFSMKEAKANSITQKIMMDLMMKMMSEEGGGQDTEGLEKMMASMGGAEGPGGMGGMGAGRTPEDHKREVEALKAMVESGDCPKEEVDSLRKMYTDGGMDIDKLVNDPTMEANMDENAKEVVVLLRKLLAQWPK